MTSQRTQASFEKKKRTHTHARRHTGTYNNAHIGEIYPYLGSVSKTTKTNANVKKKRRKNNQKISRGKEEIYFSKREKDR